MGQSDLLGMEEVLFLKELIVCEKLRCRGPISIISGCSDTLGSFRMQVMGHDSNQGEQAQEHTASDAEIDATSGP